MGRPNLGLPMSPSLRNEIPAPERGNHEDQSLCDRRPRSHPSASFDVSGQEKKGGRERNARKNGSGAVRREATGLSRTRYSVGFRRNYSCQFQRETVSSILAALRRDGLSNPPQGFEARQDSPCRNGG